jgi:hypothetical protein
MLKYSAYRIFMKSSSVNFDRCSYKKLLKDFEF